MSESMIPTRCFLCDVGRIVRQVCKTCGAMYGNKLKTRFTRKGGFVLPKVKEANPTHLEKRFRPK